jgi:hypothetical protein
MPRPGRSTAPQSLTAVSAAALVVAVVVVWLLAAPDPTRPGVHPPASARSIPVLGRQTAESAEPTEPPRFSVERGVTTPSVGEEFCGRLRHDDGRPAAGLPFWVWRGPTPRQAWLPAGDRGIGVPSPELGGATGKTGPDGDFAVPGARPDGVTFRLDERLLFSFTLADQRAPGMLVLPPLGSVTVRVEGAPDGARWSVGSHPGVDDGAGGIEYARSLVQPMASAGGQVVVFVSRSVADLGGDAVHRIVAPLGQMFGFEIGCLGVALDRALVYGAAPADLYVRAVGAQPGIAVTVVDADGTPTSLDGHAVCTDDRLDHYALERLTAGRARFVDGLEVGQRYRIRIALADGEVIDERVDFGAEARVHHCELVRTGPRVVVPRPIDGSRIAAALVIAADGSALAASPWQNQYFMRDGAPVTLGTGPRGLGLGGAPGEWSRIVLLGDDGRAFELGPGSAEPVPLPAEPLRPLDLEELRTTSPGSGHGFFAFDLLHTDVAGATCSVALRTARFDPATPDLPDWRLWVPRGFRPMLQLRNGQHWRELRPEWLR